MPGVDFLANARVRAFITREVLAERMRQHDKLGQQRFRDHGTYDRAEFEFLAMLAHAERQISADPETKTWQSLLLEQVYGAMAADELPAMRQGLVQAAAVLMAWIEDIDTRPAPGGGVDGS
ncbi:hypothetical protein [Nonomuraea cavernae]|uniref:Uncharacterized protein n=1 Tax=Nonomuraea cavernae TaxID=2045107 RepID=A0A917YQ05_9ACTN|nr:hypothetical protein [Nonomuraea cavernae]MCA2184677.1 hypothetical protein [Nonomuraea cavernae]GGO63089.1 hypothetical protein GCM10012289_09200 [Nonomuraea cavernae]